MPYSGPASAYGTIGRSHAPTSGQLNAAGGINGRQIEFISVDDGYSPPKTVEQTRRLVEQESVAMIFAPLGTPTSVATRKYLNDKKIPQLFIGSGATFWGDQKAWPFSMGWAPTYAAEGAAYAGWLLRNKPQARLAMMGQNDDSGRDYMDGCTRGFGEDATRAIAYRTTYEVTDPTLDFKSLHPSSPAPTRCWSRQTPNSPRSRSGKSPTWTGIRRSSCPALEAPSQAPSGPPGSRRHKAS